MTAHVHIDPTTDPVTDAVEFCRVCNPLPQYKETVDEGGGVSVIGPMEIAFNTVADHEVNGKTQWHKLADLAVGTWVIYTSIQSLVAWDDGTACNAQMYIDDGEENVNLTIGPAVDLNSGAIAAGADFEWGVTNSYYPGQDAQYVVTSQADSGVARISGLSLWLKISPSDDDAAHGLLRAFALIAAPA